MHPLLKFHNPLLLKQALTHRSYVKENPQEPGNNERLEFLGDAILAFLSAQYLYRRYPTMAEGEMTRRRSALVDETQLARFAQAIHLHEHMRLGNAVIQANGYQNANLLSSTFEAVIGAYHLDHDSDVELIRVIVEALFETVPIEELEQRSQLDPKNQFQEWGQKHLGEIPTYKSRQIGGPDHAPQYEASVLIADKVYGKGYGPSKKEAERQAAQKALAMVRQQETRLR